MLIERAPLRVILEDINEFMPRKFVMTEVIVDRAHEEEIFRRIHRPAMTRKILPVRYGTDAKFCLMAEDVARHMLAILGVMNGALQLLENIPAEHFHIQTAGIRAVEHVRRIVALPFLKLFDHTADNHWIDERAIRRDANDNIRVTGTRRVSVALEHVIRITAEKRNAFFAAEIGDHIVRHLIRGRDEHFIEQLAGARPFHHVEEERFLQDFRQNLAGQARGGHARLDDGYGLHAHHAIKNP